MVALPAYSADSTGVAVSPDIGVLGSVAMTYGSNPISDKGALFLNLGGPNVTVKFGSSWWTNVGMLPTLRLQEDDILRPTLGAGASIGWKRMFASCNFYFLDAGSSRQWMPTFGLGVKL